ncbi:MAG TPA: ABC transporter permease, partial [Gemmatimonadaceae bacterium]
MSVLESLRRDTAYAVRSLRREMTLVAGVVATFALAIGTNAAMLGLVTRLMLAPPPGIREPERVARIRIERTDADGESFAMTTVSYPVFRALEEVKRGFASVAAVRTDTMMVGRGSDLTPAAVVQASGNYFSVVGATAHVGRFFGPADDELPIGNFVVVLSHAYWKRRCGEQRSVIGSSIVIDGQPFTIVGVAPRGFNGDELAPVDLFMPFSAALRTREFGWWMNDRINLASVLVRIAPSVRPAAAAEMATAAYLGRQTSAVGMRASIRLDPIVPGKESRSSPQAKIALWLSGVSIIVLLIATANVGTLLLLRAAKQRRDTAVRLALGAAHRDLARQLVIESLLLALVGAVAGLVLSRWFGGVLRATLLPNVAPGEGFVDTRVLVASMIAAALAGLLAAVSPLLHARHRNVSDDLRNGAGSGSSGRFALQNLLVGVQVALCTVLLVGAGLFVRSLQRVQSQDLGFSTAGLLHVTIDYRRRLGGRERDQAHREAVERVKQLAFVRSASVVQAMPFGNFHVPPISIPGVPESKWLDKQPPYLYGATPEYLSMMRVKAVQGRLFTEADERSNQLVVLVNESFARAAWPGESAIGKCLRAGHGSGLPVPGDFGATTAGLPCRTVVGVVRDSRARSLRTDGDETHFMQYYVPFTQL